LDIEDLKNYGIKHKVCPFYLQRDLVENADLVLMTVSNLIDDKLFEQSKVNLQGSVIVIDEAHYFNKEAE
jgi:regulator of telomere elongation helicase 1